jgi:hypothetical protein
MSQTNKRWIESAASSSTPRQIHVELDNHELTEDAEELVVESKKPHSYTYEKPTALCESCHAVPAYLRRVTDQYLCQNCRQLPMYHLISKTRVLDQYRTLLWPDLIHAVNTDLLQCKIVPNWYNANAPPVKLYFEAEIQQLVQLKADNKLPWNAQELIDDKKDVASSRRIELDRESTYEVAPRKYTQYRTKPYSKKFNKNSSTKLQN